MKALCVNSDRSLEARDVPRPEVAAPDHLILRSAGSAINPGDKFFLRNPSGLPPRSNDVWGASGAGTVIAVGPGVDGALVGKRVATYRSLVASNEAVGCWSEYQHLPLGCCCLLPDDVDPLDASGSLVNAITPYAFWEQAKEDGHTGVVATAGSSATGMAMLGLALAKKIPLVSIVTSEAAKEKLLALGATHVLVQHDASFAEHLQRATESAKATAIFDGVSGELVTRVLPLVPARSTVYGYGFLGGAAPVSVPGHLMMAKSLTLRSFGNFASPTVRDPRRLQAALKEIGGLMAMPHFHTRRGQTFGYAEIERALAYEEKDGGRAILVP